MTAEISLEGLEFFAYHGYYSEERKMGNKYGIDVTVKVDLGNDINDDNLSNTIDYEKVYTIIKHQMEHPTKLLESIAANIANTLLNKFEQVTQVIICVSKFNPPVGGICQKASVRLVKNRNH